MNDRLELAMKYNGYKLAQECLKMVTFALDDDRDYFVAHVAEKLINGN
jgi:hypothetical protein